MLVTDSDRITRPVEVVPGTVVDIDANRRLTLQRDGHPHTFRVRPAPLTDSGDTHAGHTLVF
jgi:hypothetical protein